MNYNVWVTFGNLSQRVAFHVNLPEAKRTIKNLRWEYRTTARHCLEMYRPTISVKFTIVPVLA
jgi:hypothetical protein